MITVTKYPNNYSFTGNPVVFEVSTDSDESIDVEISTGGKTYSTTYYPFKISEGLYKISMNLSDYLHFDNNPVISYNEIISVIDGFVQSYQVKIGNAYTFNGFALKGGISNQALKILDENGYNIFTYRLASPFDQFLFTTRTNGKEIRIKETELYPFIFRHPGVQIVFRSESGDEITTPVQAAGTFCAMNIKAVLAQMSAGTRRIEVCPNREYAFHFTVLPGKLSEERYLLQFRNSLGAFEVLEVTGKALHNPEFSEENLWQTLTEFDFYEERRSRVKSKGVIEVETGYKERGEFPFILDLIQSDEIYFIYPDGDTFRCHVKADSAQYRHLMTEPTSVKLKITPVMEEEFVTPKIEFPEDGDISLALSKYNVTFNENGGSESIDVIISGTMNKSYSILNLPSWLTVTDKSATGFTLMATASPDENNRAAELAVALDNYPSIRATLHVNQGGQWLSTFIFDVNIKQDAVGNDIRIFNLGTDPSFSRLGEARVDWEGNGNWDTILNVPYGIPLTPAPNDPATGGTINVMIGKDYPHTYQTQGSRTVTVQTRNGVNVFRFATPSPATNNEGFDMLPTSDINQYVTKIRKIKSDYIRNGNMMFYGVKYGDFDLTFVLECPNIESFNYMFYFFGWSDYGWYHPDLINYSLLFPPNFWNNIINKTATHVTRMYAASGFLKIPRSMLKFSTQLISVLECWRGCPYVGNNWAQRTGASYNRIPIVEEFLEKDLFWDNHNINDFRGAFFWMNEQYGNYPVSGFVYPLTIRADLFKYNTAQNIDLSWMFRQSNRSIIEVDLFRYIKDRLVKMNGMFWGAWNYGGSPVIGVDGNLLAPSSIWNNAPANNPEWAASEFNLDYRGAADLNLLFPDSSYPSVREAVYLFGWKRGSGGTDNNGTNTTPAHVKRGVMNGAHLLMNAYNNPGRWNVTWRYDEYNTDWTHIMQSQISIAAFLSKFPNATKTSGKKPSDGSPCDAFYGAFWDFDVIDNPSSNLMRASDYNNVPGRNDVFLEANQVEWGYGNTIIQN